MTGRRRHPKKDVEKALRFAEAKGWTVVEIHGDHRWGVVTCGLGCEARVYSTPRNPGDHAKTLRAEVVKCLHRDASR